jgi:hypothetical protein
MEIKKAYLLSLNAPSWFRLGVDELRATKGLFPLVPSSKFLNQDLLNTSFHGITLIPQTTETSSERYSP